MSNKRTKAHTHTNTHTLTHSQQFYGTSFAFEVPSRKSEQENEIEREEESGKLTPRRHFAMLQKEAKKKNTKKK